MTKKKAKAKPEATLKVVKITPIDELKNRVEHPCTEADRRLKRGLDLALVLMNAGKDITGACYWASKKEFAPMAQIRQLIELREKAKTPEDIIDEMCQFAEKQGEQLFTDPEMQRMSGTEDYHPSELDNSK